MALITYILIAIPVCLLAVILWLYFNYWKYKRKNHFILLILLFYPVLSYAQYMDKTQCKISFSSHANQAGKLEYTQDGIIYRFTPESNAWKITIKNNTNKNARINWEKGSFRCRCIVHVIRWETGMTIKQWDEVSVCIFGCQSKSA